MTVHNQSKLNATYLLLISFLQNNTWQFSDSEAACSYLCHQLCLAEVDNLDLFAGSCAETVCSCLIWLSNNCLSHFNLRCASQPWSSLCLPLSTSMPGWSGQFGLAGWSLCWDMHKLSDMTKQKLLVSLQPEVCIPALPCASSFSSGSERVH